MEPGKKVEVPHRRDRRIKSPGVSPCLLNGSVTRTVRVLSVSVLVTFAFGFTPG